MKAIWLAVLLAVTQPSGLQAEQSSDHLTVTLGEGSTLSVNRMDYALPGITMVDLDKFDQLAARIRKQTLEPAKNAFIGPSGGIVPEKPGRQLDQLKFLEQFYGYFHGTGPMTIDLPMKPVLARVDRELLASIRQRPIAYYVTYYNSRNTNRAHNIALAASAINNTVVFPGERFSFNKVVGRRTKAGGYKEAPVIVRGELSEGIGGGICQVSSTLFNATDRAGLHIIERYSHSRSVPYVRSGRDATVSWDGPDFTFRNQYNQPVLIRAYARHGTMSVGLFSSEEMEYKPRNVPGMNEELPEEVPAAVKKKPAQAH
ncbi:vancomycin resistance protein YoaR [Paenibacillus phyllosphaerae]|uniref:Vancomycin resistance protein YoaR n=1 Tax=Paenibacillus phyllosphaerae TaxID=274593 RepID=A0A7W5ATT2_9BACL|nr:VanW family protein [Paenibacillus phyllosphaerae]MBB3108650.1 vancomycin resistance protein YoaR [Paenibacillus phyllosphaerae]